MTSEGRASRVPLLVWPLAVVLVALIVGAAWLMPPEIERALVDETTVVLGEAGSPLTVVFDGRDARLSGVAADPAQVDEAQRLVASVPGVRAVDLSSVMVSGPPSTEPAVTIRFDGLNLVLPLPLP